MASTRPILLPIQPTRSDTRPGPAGDLPVAVGSSQPPFGTILLRRADTPDRPIAVSDRDPIAYEEFGTIVREDWERRGFSLLSVLTAPRGAGAGPTVGRGVPHPFSARSTMDLLRRDPAARNPLTRGPRGNIEYFAALAPGATTADTAQRGADDAQAFVYVGSTREANGSAGAAARLFLHALIYANEGKRWAQLLVATCYELGVGTGHDLVAARTHREHALRDCDDGAADEIRFAAICEATHHGVTAPLMALYRPGDVGRRLGANGLTLLHFACVDGDSCALRWLLQQEGADPNILSDDTQGGQPPLFVAAQRGHVNLVEQLIQAGATVDTATPEGETALRLAAHQGHWRVVSNLLRSDRGWDWPLAELQEALRLAAADGPEAGGGRKRAPLAVRAALETACRAAR